MGASVARQPLVNITERAQLYPVPINGEADKPAEEQVDQFPDQIPPLSIAATVKEAAARSQSHAVEQGQSERGRLADRRFQLAENQFVVDAVRHMDRREPLSRN